jgi:hypothetical protein
MTGFLRRCLTAFLFVTFAIEGEAVEPRVLVLHDDTVVAQQATGVLGSELARAGWGSSEMALDADKPSAPGVEGEQMLVAFGSRAFRTALRLAAGRPVVGALLPASSIDEAPVVGERWSAIVLDQPIDRWLNLVQLAFPGRQAGMLVSPSGQKTARAIERRLAERRQTLVIEPITMTEEVVPALERLMPRMSLLLALPDPQAHNRNTVQPLLLTTYRVGIPVVAYSESYQQAGAVLALYSTVPQIVSQVMETLRQLQDGKSPANIQPPRYFTVGLNSAVARSLGLQLPSATELTDRVRAAGS